MRDLAAFMEANTVDVKAPPVSADMERAVLGACLVTAEAVATCMDLLSPGTSRPIPCTRACMPRP